MLGTCVISWQRHHSAVTALGRVSNNPILENIKLDEQLWHSLFQILDHHMLQWPLWLGLYSQNQMIAEKFNLYCCNCFVNNHNIAAYTTCQAWLLKSSQNQSSSSFLLLFLAYTFFSSLSSDEATINFFIWFTSKRKLLFLLVISIWFFATWRALIVAFILITFPSVHLWLLWWNVTCLRRLS